MLFLIPILFVACMDLLVVAASPVQRSRNAIQPPVRYHNASSSESDDHTHLEPVRGVNIGGWLVLEKWMTSDLFKGTNATDQYTFDATPSAKEKLKTHWETFFTEADVEKIASRGINALRIPIGYWSYDNRNTPYISGADVYLEKALGWARKHGLKVLVDCHGSPGSQNGFDNSGQAGQIEWQTGNNLNRSISVLQTMARKYGSLEFADVVLGLQLINEPAYWSPNNFNITKSWTLKAYHAVKAAAPNKDLLVIMHDSFKGPSNWLDISAKLNKHSTKISNSKFAIDTHLYQNQQAGDSLLNQPEHIQKACNWTRTDLLPPNSTLPVFVGEFSAQTNICANPDGTTLAGSVCYIDGCQCSSNVDVKDWKLPLILATRQFLEAELDAFEYSARGWFMWTYRGPGAWGMEDLIKYSVLGPKVTDRMHPDQCGFMKR